MPATAKRATTAFVPLPDAPKPWTRTKPKGMHVINSVISKETRDKVWKFFHPKTGQREGAKPADGDFQWYQRWPRFPKTAHFNGWHSGQFAGDEGSAKFEREYPELYAAVSEAVANVNASRINLSDVPSWDTFKPESVAVMRYLPNWGLGSHYDNVLDPGVGTVLMLSISDNDAVPRKFKFSDPPRGRQYEVDTYDGQAIVFGGECYDEWQHGSVCNPKQTGETISMTVRLAKVCGAGKNDGHGAKSPYVANSKSAPEGGRYATGATAALEVVHGRIGKQMAIHKLSAQCAKRACEIAIADSRV